MALWFSATAVVPAGYEDAVRRELEGEARVWTPDQNGGTSANVLDHLDEWIVGRGADVVHLNCGLHDLAKSFESGEPRIPLEHYSANIRAVFDGVREAATSALIWATTTPVNEDWHHRNKDFDRLEDDVHTYNDAAAAVAVKCDVPVNDLYAVIDEAGRDRLLQPDGVHFGDEGCALLGAAVARFLRPYLA